MRFSNTETRIRTLLALCAALCLGAAAFAQPRPAPPDMIVGRMDRLLHLSGRQFSALMKIVEEQNYELQRLEFGADRIFNGAEIRQAARFKMRGVLTAEQQAIYDVTPQIDGGGASFDPQMMVNRLNKLVGLSSAQKDAACAVFCAQLRSLGPLTPDERMGDATVPIAQKMRADIRALLTPEQQHIYDISPQKEGGGSMVKSATDRTEALDRAVNLTDSQVLQVATIYTKQVDDLAALDPKDRTGPKAAAILKATKAAIRAVLTPEQQAKFDANPNGAADMEVRAFVTNAIKSSAKLAARLGPIDRVALHANSVVDGSAVVTDDQNRTLAQTDAFLMGGQYTCGVSGPAGKLTLTVKWKCEVYTGAPSIVSVVDSKGQAVQL